MKLLSVCNNPHDSNISYYDGHTLHYYKPERDVQIKHYRVIDTNEIETLIKIKWGISFKDMDYICSTPYPISNYDTVEHHLAHKLSMDLISPAKVSIVIDGEGDKKSFSVYKQDVLVDFGLVDTSGSIGHGIVSLGKFMGILGNSLDIPGKLMGLQSYGNINVTLLEYLQQFDIKNIGSKMLRSTLDKEPIFVSGDLLFSTQHNIPKLDIIKTIHTRCGEIILELFLQHALPEDTISYSGGVAQNVIWNTIIKERFKNLTILPHCTDEGLSLGGIEYLRKKHSLPSIALVKYPYIQSDQSPDVISSTNIKKVAKLLSQGKIIAWYQGNGEIGPRALGNRSILMDASISNGKDLINSVKRREYYRPFGASVLYKDAKNHFDLDYSNPFMLYTANVVDPKLKSITHVDGTCRIQTVEYGIFAELLTEFKNITGHSVLLNTSLNLSGKPIAGNISDAIKLFETTSIDVLVVGNTIFEK